MNIVEGGDNLDLPGDNLNFKKEVSDTYSESDERQKKLGISIVVSELISLLDKFQLQ